MKFKATVIRVDDRGYGREAEEEFELPDDHPVVEAFERGWLRSLSIDGEEVEEP